MSSSLEDIVTCAVCLRRYTDPRVLPCQHSFCLRPCLEEIYNPNTRRIRCPLCREDHLMLKGVAASLPINRTIINLLDISPTNAPVDEAEGAAGPRTLSGSSTEASWGAAALPADQSSYCPLCHRPDTELEHCAHCSTEICFTCIAGHKRHLRSDVGRRLSQLRRQLPQFTECISLTNDRIGHLSSSQSAVMADIDRAFDELVQLVQRRRRELIEEAENGFAGVNRHLRSEKETLEVDYAALSSLCQLVGDRIAQRDIRMTELSEVNGICEEYMSQEQLEGPRSRGNVLNETLKRARFHHDLTQLRSSILSFGSVLWSERSHPSDPPASTGLVEPSNQSGDAPPYRAAMTRRAGEEPYGSSYPPAQPRRRWDAVDVEPRPIGIAGHRVGVSGANSSPSDTGGIFLSLENPSLRRAQQPAAGSGSGPVVSPNPRRHSNTVRGGPAPETIDRSPDPDTVIEETLGSLDLEEENSNTRPSASEGPEEPVPPGVTHRLRERTFVLDRLPRPIAFEVTGESISPSNEPSGMSRYADKGVPLLVFGERGSGPGQFCWPRGIAVARESNGEKIVVADSSNHRIQIFGASGEFVTSVGSYGSGEAEFECLSGVAVDGMGQLIASDRYNHRLMVLDRQGRFVQQVGELGVREGQLSYPWGVATDQCGFLYVCDKENHRVQVFAQNGVYVRQFGSPGHRPGELENPHYLAVSSEGRVYVSDTSNHRVQVFDQRGNYLFKFGGDGTGPGQIKFPRGIAIDDEGNVVLADSGNNRIQVFTSTGQFVMSFGAYGSGQGQFKGLEGLALFPNGRIVVCDRDNHRVQLF